MERNKKQNIMKIQVKTTKVTTKEVEIEFPYYTGNGCHFYKVVNEKSIIQVCTLEGNERIEVSYMNFALEAKKCKKEVFDKAYAKVLKILSI